MRVLSHERLLAPKKQLGRAEDLVMVPIIEATLRERDERKA